MTEVDNSLNEYLDRVNAISERARAAQQNLARIHPSVTGGDGAVTVTVSSVGALVDISFGPSARDLDLAELASLVKRTAQAARIRAAHETQDALAGLVGNNSDTMNYLRRQLPGLSEDEPDLSARPGGAARPPADRRTPPDEDDGFAGRGA